MSYFTRLLKGFNPDEPRANDGKWSSSGGGSGYDPSVHPETDDQGNTVKIKNPTEAQNIADWHDGSKDVTFTPGHVVPGMSEWTDAPEDNAGWEKLALANPVPGDVPMNVPAGAKKAAGVIIKEPDGRIWLTEPTNHFGGYEATFPKGTVEPGMSLAATAIKEAYEETGLAVRLTGMVGDFQKTTSSARFYTAERIGGTPEKMGWESQAMHLVTPQEANTILNMKVDRSILRAVTGYQSWSHGQAMAAAAKAPQPAPAMQSTASSPSVASNKAISEYAKAYMSSGFSDKMLGLAGNLAALHGPSATDSVDFKGKVFHGLMDAAKNGVITQDEAVKISEEPWSSLYKNLQTDGLLKKPAPPSSGSKGYSLDHLNAMVSATPASPASPPEYKMNKVSGAKGSNPGGLYADEHGNQRYVKFYKNPEQGRTEALASALYEEMGVKTPSPSTAIVNGKEALVTKWNTDLQQLKPTDFEHVGPKQQLQIAKAYMASVLTKNWDVVGLSHDNLVRNKVTGDMVEVDTGGSFNFRAQGEHKDFGHDIGEYKTLMDKQYPAGQVFTKIFENDPGLVKKALGAVKGIDMSKIKSMFASSGLKNQAELYDAFSARRDLLLAKGGMNQAKEG